MPKRKRKKHGQKGAKLHPDLLWWVKLDHQTGRCPLLAITTITKISGASAFGWAVVGLAQIFHPFSSPLPFPAFTWYYVESASFLFLKRKTQLRRSFLNAVGLNWQKGPRHGATLYPPSALPPFAPLLIYIYNSIKRPVDAPRHCWHLVILTSRCETSLIQQEIARQDEREAARTFLSLEQPFRSSFRGPPADRSSYRFGP